jgi:putative spermidine/putrescine transport system permease protein
MVKLVLASLQPSNLLGSRGMGNYLQFVRIPADFRALLFTFLDSALVTILAVILGSTIAWSLHTIRSRAARSALWTAVLVPFWMGIVIKNYLFSILLDRLGPVSNVLQATGLAHGPVGILYTQAAVIIGMLYSMLPYAVLPMFSAFATIDDDMVHAAESMGASRAYALRTTVLPLVLPLIFATTVIVFVISIGFYITPLLLGGVTVPFIANNIQYRLFTAFDYPSAATAGIFLLAAALVVIAVAQLLVGRERLEQAIDVTRK